MFSLLHQKGKNDSHYTPFRPPIYVTNLRKLVEQFFFSMNSKTDGHHDVHHNYTDYFSNIFPLVKPGLAKSQRDLHLKELMEINFFVFRLGKYYF